MASIVLTAAGQAIAPGIGGALLGALGAIAGSYIDNEIFGLGPRRTFEGPRLENLKVQDSRYGAGMAIVYGRARVAGNVIWATDLIETRQEQNQGGGGKGGGGGGVTTVRYTYSVSCAVGICFGPVASLHAVWADGKQIFDGTDWKAGLNASVTFYHGTTTQNADPVMQGALGAANVPAYRGLAYIVFENLQLADFGNRLPNLTFEITANDTAADPRWLDQEDVSVGATMDALRAPQGAPLIPVRGDSNRVREVVTGGYLNPGGSCQFEAVRYDVTTETPIELSRVASATFATSANIQDSTHAISPDQRVIAFAVQSSVPSAGQTTFALYDVGTAAWGAPLTITSATNPRAIGWLDPFHFIISDTSGTTRGVRLFARAGLGLVDRGFTALWGAGSASTRFDVNYGQFLPLKDGLLVLKADALTDPAAFYACHVRLVNGIVTAGTPYTLTTTVPGGAGNQTALHHLGDDEWVLTLSRPTALHLFSFSADVNTASETRPWQSITLGGNSTTNAPVLLNRTKLIVLQRYATENNYRLADVAINAADFSLIGSEGAVVADYTSPHSYFSVLKLDQDRIAVQGGTNATNTLLDVAVIERLPAGDTLQNIITDLLARAGYAGGDYSVADLAATRLEGYVLAEPTSARQAVDVLRGYAPFDLIENGDQLKARVREGAVDQSVPLSELRAASAGEDHPPALTQTRAQELDLPRDVTVEHLDPAREYEVGAQRARRIVSAAKSTAKVSLPVVCRASTAKQIAERSLFAAWAERDRVNIRLSRRYAFLEPGDVIEVDGVKLRLTSLRHNTSLIEAEALLMHADAYTSTAEADGGTGGGRRSVTIVATSAYLMDVPMLAPEHDQPGVYVAFSGADGWPGGSLWRSADGINFANLTASTGTATAGMAAQALSAASFAATAYMDRANTVDVQLLQGSLASVTEAELLNGANTALLGGEIIQFQTATLVSAGYYTLSNLLRGRRGTEAVAGTHVVGERFVLLNSASVQFLPATLADRSRVYEFRALSIGQTLADVQNAPFTYQLKTLEPLAPVHVSGTRASGTGTDLTISWKRRTRFDGEWADGIEAPLNEDSELYDLEIMNGSAVLRTVNNLTTPAHIYTAAEQTADWGVVPATFTVKIYQLSARYGRGQNATAIV